MKKNEKTAIIIGAGPSGLSAAYELIKTTDILPIIVEMSNDIGGISQTKNFNGNRMDLGGHRFFSKSERVMNFWKEIMPFEDIKKKYRKNDKIFLIRNRLSRILYNRKFFDYPISLNFDTIKKLGLFKTFKMGVSYIKSMCFPIKKEKSLEDFFINRFGKELYKTFFKDYTEKVWGVSCRKISPDWGAQRVKDLSVIKAIFHALSKPFRNKNISQKNIETTLIEKFLYPKHGPGEFWEEVSKIIIDKGGLILKNNEVIKIYNKNNKIDSLDIKDKEGNIKNLKGDFFISSMPIKDLIKNLSKPPSENVLKIAKGLVYRDFITVGLLLKNLNLNKSKIKDNWIYVQEPDVSLGRIQIFNNWSPYMVKDKNTIFMGLEYFSSEGDFLWNMSEEDFISYSIKEIEKLKIAEKKDILKAYQVKVKKAYPAYFGSYKKFIYVKKYLDNYSNLYLVGRNGQHKYNNMDHSILTAFEAVYNIKNNILTKENIWNVNTEKEYHESKKFNKKHI